MVSKRESKNAFVDKEEKGNGDYCGHRKLCEVVEWYGRGPYLRGRGWTHCTFATAPSSARRVTSPLMPFHVTPHTESLPTARLGASEWLLACVAMCVDT